MPAGRNILGQTYDAFAEKIKTLILPTVKSKPGPITLVNLETEFFAANIDPFAFNVTVAGVVVHLQVHPTHYTWHFADGTVDETATPNDVHTYKTLGKRVVRVDVEWGGTFTIGNQAEVYAIDPPAEVAGAPGAVDVHQARAQLVS